MNESLRKFPEQAAKHRRSWSQIFFVILMSGFLFQGCAHKTTETQTENESEDPVVQLHELNSFRLSDPAPPAVVDEELEKIPVEVNPSVEKWIAYFQGRGRPHMERFLARSTRYMALMKRILRQNGMPEDLIYIALIESGFSSKATSRAAAVGYWQFIRGTGRRYGLAINSMVDERRDPVLSTQAAAEYYKNLYGMFGSWYLSMAAYNVGENRVKKEILRNNTRDFWELARRKRLPAETINYVPKYLAAKLIAKNPKQYGFDNIEYMTPIEFELVQLSRPVNIKKMAELMGLEYDDMKSLNPKFRGEIAPLKNGTLELRIPIGQQQSALAAAQQSFVEKVVFVADAGETLTHKVRPGDSLHTIARKYRTTVAWLRDFNDLKKGRPLRIGQRLQVPDRSGRSSNRSASRVEVAKVEKSERVEKDRSQERETEVQSESKAVPRPEVVTAKGVFYVVQRGDTLSEIAEEYDSSVEELKKMNRLKKRSVLRAGMRLRVPKVEALPSDPSGTSVAEKDSDDEEETTMEAIQHTVKPGESLGSIARQYGVTLASLRKANNISNRSTIRAGSRLVIPKVERSVSSQRSSLQRRNRPSRVAKVHVVKRGDSLAAIAQKYNVPVTKIKKKNRLQNASHLLVGSRLLIPEAAAAD